MRLLSHPIVARSEALQFQGKNAYGKKAEEIITRIKAKVDEGYVSLEVQKLPEIEELQKLIYDTFNMNMQIVTTGNLAGVIPLYMIQNHIYKHKMMREGKWSREQDVLAEKDQVGWVDDSDGTVGGVFSTYRVTLYLNFNEMLGTHELTPAIVVGIKLHEIGHYYDGCKTIAQRDRQNAVFREAISKMATSDEGERQKIIYRVAKDFKLDQKALADMTSRNPVTVGIGAQKVIAEYVAQQQEDGVYDRTGFETMADIYAARFGYSKEVVEGLAILVRSQVTINYQFTMVLRSMMEAINAAKLIISLYIKLNALGSGILSFGLLTSVLVWIAYGTYSLYIYVKSSGDSGNDYTYDDMAHRFRRLRAEMISQVKDNKFTKADAEQILISLNFMTARMEEFSLWRGPLDTLFNILNPKDRRAHNSIERQRAIEDLYSNPLVIKAMELQLAAKQS